MKYAKRIALLITASLVLTVFVSMGTEYYSMMQNKSTMETAAYLAYQYAIQAIQSTDSSTLVKDANNPSATIQTERYGDYLGDLEQMYNSVTTTNSSFSRVLQFLKNNLAEYKSNKTHELFTPLQFGITYVDEDSLQSYMQEYLSKVIESNHFTSSDIYSDSVKVTITSITPSLVNIKDSANSAIYLELFGISNTEGLSSVEGLDSMYDYVVKYDISFTVEWMHPTSSRLFNLGYLSNFRIDISGLDLTDAEQIQFAGPDVEYSFTYVLTN